MGKDWVMASMDNANHDESGEAAPPHGGSDFGPPVSEFGPPMDAFGPPTGESGPVGWQPADAPDRPSVGWQPADAPATPAPPAQYRAPDSTGSRETVRAPAPDPRRAPAPETVRYTDQGQQGSDQGTWWQQGAAPQAPGQQPHGQASQGHQQVSQRPPTGPRPVAGQSTGPRETPRSLWDDDDLAKKLQAPREPAQAAKGSSGGSLWDDDDLAEQFGPARTAAPSSDRGGRGRGVLIGGGIAGVLFVAAIAAIVVFVMHGKNNPQPTNTSLPPTTPSAFACAASSSAELAVGNGPGDTNSGRGAIFGYWHSYLIDRSAEKMHSFVGPSANIQSSADLQQTINGNVPTSGVNFCVKVTTLAPDQFNVDVTEHDPNGKLTVYKQLITTGNVNGKNVILQINSL
jgi:hypothetical protein